MILTCNSCNKKFVVPDQAITSSGRMVQCGSCGNKWRQFPINQNKKKQPLSKPKKIVPRASTQEIPKSRKIKKNTLKKQREISLYSPEYLAKKHGIKLDDVKTKKTVSTINKKENVSFGFYNTLILFIFIAISLSRILYFAQDFIITIFPISEFYLNYFFENIRNIFEIWKNLITY